jgi:hypothetical protein
VTELDYLPEAQRIAAEFPGWRAWTSLRGGQWHARLNDDRGNPIVLLHDDNPEGLKDQISKFAKDTLRG